MNHVLSYANFHTLFVVICLLLHYARPSGCEKIALRGIYDTAPAESLLHASPIEFVYQLPVSSGTTNGVIFLAHGCNHRATDWFPFDPSSCKKCTGLIVERSITSRALSLGLAVVAISSADDRNHCWSNEDIPRVITVLNKIFDENKMSKSHVPLYMVGASSGGAFVGSLASYLVRSYSGNSNSVARFHVKSVCIQISSISLQELKPVNDVQARTPYPFPPPSILFNQMPRDAYTARAVKRLSKALMEHETVFSKSGISVLVLETKPAPISHSFFSKERGGISLMNSETSKSIVGALIASGLLDNDGMLRGDPREVDWRSAVSKVPLSPYVDTLEADRSNISELLNLAYAGHEITDDKINEALDWMMAATTSSDKSSTL